MKKFILFALFSLFCTASFSQLPNPERWEFTVAYSSPGEATLHFHVELEKDWHIYSQHTPDGGPLPMIFKFTPGSCYQLVGNVLEPKPHEEYDSTFGVKVLIFDKEVTFTQKVKLNQNSCKITGMIEYQICKEACIFKETNFEFNVRGK